MKKEYFPNKRMGKYKPFFHYSDAAQLLTEKNGTQTGKISHILVES